MTKRNVFVSFHQDDQVEAGVFRQRFAQYFNEIRLLGVKTSENADELAERIGSGDSDYVMRRIREKYIRGTSCTIVLIGKCTWARRYVDWEIAATLRNNPNDPRGGLLAVQLPSTNGDGKLPERLAKNAFEEDGFQVGYARVHPPPPSDATIVDWVEGAIVRRDSMEPVPGSTTDLRVRSSTCE